ncbi:O-antigen ligase [Veillonella sp. AS16]|nr:O-antigen ligase [Veillonella sp. AS16]
MKSWVLNNYEIVLTALISIMICTTRSSMAFGNFIYSLILLMTVITWIYMRRDISVSLVIRQYAWAYAGMILCVLPSVLMNDHMEITIKYFFNIWIWKAFILVPIFLFIKDKRKLYALLMVFFIYMAIDSLSAFGQYYMEYNTHDGRSGGVFRGSVMGLAMLLTFAFPLTMIVLFDKQMPWYVRVSAIFSSLSIVFGMWGNQSRGSWLFNGFNGILITLRYCLVNVKYILLLIIMIVGIGYTFSQHQDYVDRFKSTFNTTTDGSNLGRLYVWESDKKIIKDHFLIGVGPGLWQQIYRERYKLTEETQDLAHSHNNMLQIMTESGILGLFGFLGFSWFVIYRSLKNYIRHINPYDLSIIIGFISYLFLFGSIDYTWGNSSGIRIFWVVMGLMVQLSIQAKSEYLENNKN